MSFDDGVDSIEIDMTSFDTAWVATVTSLGERIQERVNRWRTDESREAAPAQGMAFQARHQLTRGHYSQASELLEAVIADSPEMTPAWEMLVRSRVAMGDIDAARAAVEGWQESGDPNAPSASDVADLTLAMEFSGAQGYWAWNAQRLENLLEEGRPIPFMELATAHAALGNSDEAFDYLIEALESGEPTVMGIRSDPAWDDLRADDRYREIGRMAQEMMRSRPMRPRRNGRN